MRTNKADIDDAISVVERHNQAVVIALDIKDDAIVSEKTGGTIGEFDVGRRFPCGAFCLVIPGTQRLFRIGMVLPKFA